MEKAGAYIKLKAAIKSNNQMFRETSPDCSTLCVEMTCLVQHNGHSGNETENMPCTQELIHS